VTCKAAPSMACHEFAGLQRRASASRRPARLKETQNDAPAFHTDADDLARQCEREAFKEMKTSEAFQAQDTVAP